MLQQVKKILSNYTPQEITAPLPEAAILVLILLKSEKAHFVLTKRAMTLSTHAGEVCFPGGKKDRTDADLLETALREAEEEIGLSREKVEILGRLDQKRSFFGLKVTPFVALIKEPVIFLPNKKELDQIFEVPVSFFLSQENYRVEARKREDLEYWVHYFRYQKFDIWGFTAMVIIMFLNVTMEAKIQLGPHEIEKLNSIKKESN